MADHTNDHNDNDKSGEQGRASFNTGSTSGGGSNFGQGSSHLSGGSYRQGDRTSTGANYENETDKLGGSTVGTSSEGTQAHKTASNEVNESATEKMSQGTAKAATTERKEGEDQDMRHGRDRTDTSRDEDMNLTDDEK